MHLPILKRTIAPALASLLYLAPALPVFASQCTTQEYNGKNYWACPTQSQGPARLWKKRIFSSAKSSCDAFCASLPSTTVSTPASSFAAATALPSDKLLSVGRYSNQTWLDDFSDNNYYDSDTYTIYRLKIVGGMPTQKPCRNYSKITSAAKKLLGFSSVDKINFSIVLSEEPVNPRSYTTESIVVPVVEIERSTGRDCKLDYHLTDDIRVAKVISDHNIELHARGVFTFNDDQTHLKDFEQTFSGPLLGSMLNGALKTYAPYVTAFIGPGGLRTVRDENLSIGTSLATHPGEGKNLNIYPSKLFQVRLDDAEVLQVLLYQESGVRAEGVLSGQRKLANALNRQNTIAQLSQSKQSVEGRSINDILRGIDDFDFNVPKDKSTTVSDMDAFCDKLIDEIADVVTLSNHATYKLLALAMRDYHTRHLFYTTEEGRSACLPGEFHEKYQEFILRGYSPSSRRKIDEAIERLGESI